MAFLATPLVAAGALFTGANAMLDGAADAVMLFDDPRATDRAKIGQVAKVLIGALGAYGGAVTNSAPLTSKICITVYRSLGTTQIILNDEKNKKKLAAVIYANLQIAAYHFPDILEEFTSTTTITSLTKFTGPALIMFGKNLWDKIELARRKNGTDPEILMAEQRRWENIGEILTQVDHEAYELNLSTSLLSLCLKGVTPETLLTLNELPDELQDDERLNRYKCRLSRRTILHAVSIKNFDPEQIYERSILLNRIRENPHNIIEGRVVNEDDVETSYLQVEIDEVLNDIRNHMIVIRRLIPLSTRIHYHQLTTLGEIPEELRSDKVFRAFTCPYTHRPIRFAARISGEPQVYESTALVTHHHLANRVIVDRTHPQAAQYYEKADDIQQVIDSKLLEYSKIMAIIQNKEYVEDWRYDLSKSVLSSFDALLIAHLDRETKLARFLEKLQISNDPEALLKTLIKEGIIGGDLIKSEYIQTLPLVYVALPLFRLVNHYLLGRPVEEVEALERKYLGREVRPIPASIQNVSIRAFRYLVSFFA